jgi:hypothetical protein
VDSHARWETPRAEVVAGVVAQVVETAEAATEEVTALTEVPSVGVPQGEAVNAMVVAEVQRMCAVMTEGLLESQRAQLASTAEALATLIVRL